MSPYIREKALWFLENGEPDERWTEMGEKQEKAWRTTLAALREKLLSDQPPTKRVKKVSRYICPWANGDVFAYRLCGNYAAEKGRFGQFVAFRKVAEMQGYPENVFPVVNVYDWIGEDLPALDFLLQQKILPMYRGALPAYASRESGKLYSPNICVYANAKSHIPQTELFYLGNISGEDFLTLEEYMSYCSRGPDACWEKSKGNCKFEQIVLDNFIVFHDCDEDVQLTDSPGCRFHMETIQALRKEYGTGINPLKLFTKKKKLDQLTSTYWEREMRHFDEAELNDLGFLSRIPEFFENWLSEFQKSLLRNRTTGKEQ